MRDVWVVSVMVCTLWSSASSRAATETGETPQTADVVLEEDAAAERESDAEPASIADAHAQFAPVLAPVSLSLSEPGTYGSALVYMGLDGWLHGASAYVGSDWSPATDSPFIIRAFASDGVDDFKKGMTTFRSETMRASLMPGYRFQIGKFDLKVFAGGDFLARMLLRPAPEAPILVFGARASADLWWEPAADWMLSGSVSATTIERGLTARVASGRRVMSAWVGPEVLALHDIYNTQWRAGMHVSGFEVGFTEWSIAGGYAQDGFGRSGAYARFGISYRPLQ